jgi:hypothetical protein
VELVLHPSAMVKTATGDTIKARCVYAHLYVRACRYARVRLRFSLRLRLKLTVRVKVSVGTTLGSPMF